MNIWDILLTAAITAAVIYAVYSIRKSRKSGKTCCGDCTRCNSECKGNKPDTDK